MATTQEDAADGVSADLKRVVMEHMESFDISSSCDCGGGGLGRGRLGLLVNRPGRTFMVAEGGLGQQWIAKVLRPEQEEFERDRFERIRFRAGRHLVPDPVGSLSGCDMHGRTVSVLVQVRIQGTAADMARSIDCAIFVDDWMLWNSFDAFLKQRLPRARRTFAESIYRDDDFAVEAVVAELGRELASTPLAGLGGRRDILADLVEATVIPGVEFSSAIEAAIRKHARSIACALRDESRPMEWMERFYLHAGEVSETSRAREIASAIAKNVMTGIVDDFIGRTPGLGDRIDACSRARVKIRSTAYGICAYVLSRAGLAQADYTNMQNYACEWGGARDRSPVGVSFLSMPVGEPDIGFTMRMLDMGELVDVEALPDPDRSIATSVWESRYAEVVPCLSRSDIMLEALHSTRPDLVRAIEATFNETFTE